VERKKVQTKTVAINKLALNNPALCLNPLRVFENCHKCEIFLKAKYPKRLPCKPRLQPEVKQMLKVKTRLLRQIAEVNAKLSEL
jgi:hypothetical protein